MEAFSAELKDPPSWSLPTSPSPSSPSGPRPDLLPRIQAPMRQSPHLCDLGTWGLRAFAPGKPLKGLEFLMQRPGHQQDAGLATPEPAPGCHTAQEGQTSTDAGAQRLTLSATSHGPHHRALTRLWTAARSSVPRGQSANTETARPYLNASWFHVPPPRNWVEKSRETNVCEKSPI